MDGLRDEDLTPHFLACEKDLSVGLLQTPAPAASLKLHEGAARLNWKSMEVPRWFAYDETRAADGTLGGQRQSMTRTYIPRALQAGGELHPRTRITRLRREGSGWRVEGLEAGGRPVRFLSDAVFVCAGAVQTPALLLRSGISTNIGQSLQLHPTVKITAEFGGQVNFPGLGVPVHQVKEFAPRLSFGCSISSPPFLAVGMLDHPRHLDELVRHWRNAAVYYAMIAPVGTGTIRTLPGFAAPLVRYRLTAEDYLALGEGLQKLGQLLFAAGAIRQYPGLHGPRLESPKDLARLARALPVSAHLMTIHLFSSCPMAMHLGILGDAFGQPVEAAAAFRRDFHFDDGAHDVATELLLVQHRAIAEDDVAGFVGFDLRRHLGLGRAEHGGELGRLQRGVFVEQFQQWIHAAEVKHARAVPPTEFPGHAGRVRSGTATAGVGTARPR